MHAKHTESLADAVTCYALGLILAALLLGALVGVAVGEVGR